MTSVRTVLQVIHFSDSHLLSGTPKRGKWLDFLERFAAEHPTNALLQKLHRRVSHGIAGHDDDALDAFTESLSEQVLLNEQYAATPTWLVFTGDLTTFGDELSLAQGLLFLRHMREIRPDAAVVELYGNHDAWPGKFPLFASSHELTQHAERLRRESFPTTWPSQPLRQPIDGTGGEIQLYGLNTVSHDSLLNIPAMGEVGERPPDGQQLQRLVDLIDASTESRRHNIRLLASHHPVHFPSRPPFSMRLLNDENVARVLASATPRGATPAIHAVLSGHTHSTYPLVGSLPERPPLCNHPPLLDDQFQLIGGTVSQRDRSGELGLFPHRWHLLRFVLSTGPFPAMLLRRSTFGRANGIGDFILESEEDLILRPS